MLFKRIPCYKYFCFQVCTDANSFTLDAPENPTKAVSGAACAAPAAGTDTAAKEDYIEIQGKLHCFVILV